MSAYLNEEGNDIPVNTKPPKLDKAFIMLNYPPNLDDPNNLRRFVQAMIEAGVANKAAGEILEAYNNPDPTGPPNKYANHFCKVWERFSEYNKRTTHLRGGKWVAMNKATKFWLPTIQLTPRYCTPLIPDPWRSLVSWTSSEVW